MCAVSSVSIPQVGSACDRRMARAIGEILRILSFNPSSGFSLRSTIRRQAASASNQRLVSIPQVGSACDRPLERDTVYVFSARFQSLKWVQPAIDIAHAACIWCSACFNPSSGFSLRLTRLSRHSARVSMVVSIPQVGSACDRLADLHSSLPTYASSFNPSSGFSLRSTDTVPIRARKSVEVSIPQVRVGPVN